MLQADGKSFLRTHLKVEGVPTIIIFIVIYIVRQRIFRCTHLKAERVPTANCHLLKSEKPPVLKPRIFLRILLKAERVSTSSYLNIFQQT